MQKKVAEPKIDPPKKKKKDEDLVSSALKQSLQALEVITNRKDAETDDEKHNADYHFCIMYTILCKQWMNKQKKCDEKN